MAQGAALFNNGLKRFRDHLRLLAGVQINPALQHTIEPSDIVQKTLQKAWQAIEQFEGQTEAQLKAWLRPILLHTIVDEVAKLAPATRVSLEATLEASSARLERCLAAEDSSPSARAMRQEDLDRLAAALAELPEDQRQAVELKHLQGWSVEAISNHTGRTEASVAGLLRRGLRQLRASLAEEP